MPFRARHAQRPVWFVRLAVATSVAPLIVLPSPATASGQRCTPIPAAKIGFQMATVMGGFMPPGATPLPSPDPARMRAGTASPPMPRIAPDPDVFRSYLKQLRKIGFRNMERFGGTLMLPDGSYRSILKNAGMRVVSSHGSLEEPAWSAELDRAQAMKQDYVGSWGYGPIGVETYENVVATAANLERLGKVAHARGLRLMVHNHEETFRFRYPYDLDRDGRTEMVSAWEIIAARTNPRYVNFELDTHWAQKALGGEDELVKFIRRNRERIHLLHLKGMAADGSVTDLGRGTNDWPRIFAAAGKHVRYYIWEYERPADPLRSAKIAYNYLRCKKMAG